MNQLEFDFGPEQNEKVNRTIESRKVSAIYMESLAKMLCGVQPISISSSSILRIKPTKIFIPPVEKFELTEPYSESDEETGCWGTFINRTYWQRAGTKQEHKGCLH